MSGEKSSANGAVAEKWLENTGFLDKRGAEKGVEQNRNRESAEAVLRGFRARGCDEMFGFCMGWIVHIWARLAIQEPMCDSATREPSKSIEGIVTADFLATYN
jgi:hypothetical protein